MKLGGRTPIKYPNLPDVVGITFLKHQTSIEVGSEEKVVFVEILQAAFAGEIPNLKVSS